MVSAWCLVYILTFIIYIHNEPYSHIFIYIIDILHGLIFQIFTNEYIYQRSPFKLGGGNEEQYYQLGTL